MDIPWYGILIAALGGLLVLAILFVIILRLLRRNEQFRDNESSYLKLPTKETSTGSAENTNVSRFKERNQSQRSTVSWDGQQDYTSSSQLHNVTLVKEDYAETCASDIETASEGGGVAVSAYGDKTWKRDSLRTDIFQGSKSPRIQLSLIYNEDKKYIAGKITKIEDLPSRNDNGPDQIKIHLVMLPAKRYILKTRYHNLNTSTKMDEYFKMKFKVFPDLDKTAIRYRVYGRRSKFGVPGREKCLGEVFVCLSDIAKSKGGVTMWKNILPKGASVVFND